MFSHAAISPSKIYVTCMAYWASTFKWFIPIMQYVKSRNTCSCACDHSTTILTVYNLHWRPDMVSLSYIRGHLRLCETEQCLIDTFSRISVSHECANAAAKNLLLRRNPASPHERSYHRLVSLAILSYKMSSLVLSSILNILCILHLILNPSSGYMGFFFPVTKFVLRAWQALHVVCTRRLWLSPMTGRNPRKLEKTAEFRPWTKSKVAITVHGRGCVHSMRTVMRSMNDH